MTRKWDEDLQQIQNLKGTAALIARLKTSAKNGLTSQEVQSNAREDAYGNNENPEADRKTFC